MIARLRILTFWILLPFSAAGWAGTFADYGSDVDWEAQYQTFIDYLFEDNNPDMPDSTADDIETFPNAGNSQQTNDNSPATDFQMPAGIVDSGKGWAEINQEFYTNLSYEDGWDDIFTQEEFDVFREELSSLGQQPQKWDIDDDVPQDQNGSSEYDFGDDLWGDEDPYDGGYTGNASNPTYTGGYNPQYGSINPGTWQGNSSAGLDGFYTQFENDIGLTNTSIGSLSLNDNFTGHNNTASGVQALFNNLSGSYNTANGSRALKSNISGNYNSAVGGSAMRSNVSGSFNSATGVKALYFNKTGSGNSASGYRALYSNTAGKYNSAEGVNALFSNQTGKFNTAVGVSALLKNKRGSYNTALGAQGLAKLQAGERNLAVGLNAGINLIRGNYNIYVANPGVSQESKTIRIGMPGHQRTYIGGIRGRATGMADSVPVVIDSKGQLGTINSSARFKKEIKDMADTSRNLLKLRPVTYRYIEANDNGENPIEYGLIAEEVAKIYPELIAHSADGQIETVQYHKLTPMLLNEVQVLNKLLETAQSKEETLEQQLSLERNKNQQQSQQLAEILAQLQNMQSQVNNIQTLQESESRSESQQLTGHGHFGYYKVLN